MVAKNYQTMFFHIDEFADEEMWPILLATIPNEEVSTSLKKHGDLEELCSCSPLNEEQERHLFRKLNFLKYLTSKASCDEERDDRLTQASWLRNVILIHNMRLLVHVVKPYAKADLSLMELLGEASVWMMAEVIDAFDFRLGVPFGAYAAGAIRKDLWNHLNKLKRSKELTGDYVFTNVVDHRRNACESQHIADEFESIREYIYENVADDKLVDILFRRLGLANNHMETFAEIARSYQKSATWVQNNFDKTMIALFGHTVNGNFIRSLLNRRQDKRSESS